MHPSPRGNHIHQSKHTDLQQPEHRPVRIFIGQIPIFSNFVTPSRHIPRSGLPIFPPSRFPSASLAFCLQSHDSNSTGHVVLSSSCLARSYLYTLVWFSPGASCPGDSPSSTCSHSSLGTFSASHFSVVSLPCHLIIPATNLLGMHLPTKSYAQLPSPTNIVPPRTLTIASNTPLCNSRSGDALLFGESDNRAPFPSVRSLSPLGEKYDFMFVPNGGETDGDNRFTVSWPFP